MKTFISTIILGLFTLAIQVNVQAQDLYVPNGTSGVDTSTTSNVGIGVSNPSEKLHVSGNLLLDGSSTRSLFLQGNTGKLWKFGSVGSFFSLGYDGTDYMTLNNGKVGIGNATPAFNLDVAGDIRLSGAIYMGTSAHESSAPIFSNANGNLSLGLWSGNNVTNVNGKNTFIGVSAGVNAGNGSENVYIGRSAGASNTGDQSVMIGNSAGASSNGNHNVFLGVLAGQHTKSIGNIFIGRTAGRNYQGTGSGLNLVIGTNAGSGMGLNADLNTILGTGSGAIINGAGNTILGYHAGRNQNNSSNNIIIGKEAAFGGHGDNSNSDNIFLGNGAGFNAASATYNMYFGSGAGSSNTSGTKHIFMGYAAGQQSAGGISNIFIGENSGKSATGSYNLFLGKDAGLANTGSNNIFIGKNADIADASSDRLIIDNSNTATPFIDGDFAARTLKVDGTIDASGYTINGQPLTAGGSSLWSIDGDNLYRSTGRVAIGVSDYSILNTTSLTDYKLFVQGGIIAEEVQVEARLNWPDYVFELDYELMPLSELDQYIKTNKHLPNVPSAQEVANKGFKLAEMDASLLRKVEELTLHTIEQHKSIEQLMEMNKQLMEANKLQQERIEKLENTVNKLK